MTFYESALRVLEEAGKPLTHLEITQLSMDKGLLSHVGKVPEQTMLARLAAMAKRPRDRKLQVTAKDTFALTDWMLPEDTAALAATGVAEPHPEDGLPPLRPIERHPEPSAQNARGAGRGERHERKRRDRDREEDGSRRKRFPPISEVAFETLEEAGGSLAPAALLEKARAKELCGPDLATEALLYALVEDNQRRIDAGRKPQFHLRTPEGATEAILALDPNSEAPAEAVQTALCKAANIPFENGRAVLRVREERPAAVASGDDLQLVDAARQAVREARRAQARAFRRRLADLELGPFEKAIVKLLHASGFREVRVARRSREGLLMTARRRDGSLELRYGVRLLRGHATVERRHVSELRRDLGQVGGQIGLVCSAGDVRGDARAEATAQGVLVQIWGSDALAEKFFDAEVGVVPRHLSLFEFDEAFFSQATKDADDAKVRREERQRERTDGNGSADASAPQEADAAPRMEGAASPDADGGPGDTLGDDSDDEGDEEGSEGGAEAGAATPGGAEGGVAGGGRRRRRRRRRRGGRRPDGLPGGTPGGGTNAVAAGAPEGGAPAGGSAPAASAPAPAPAPAPSGDNS